MKSETPSDKLLMMVHTHDLSCTIGALGRAAHRLALPKLPPQYDPPLVPTDELAVAAVAFAIQLAIDTTKRDPADLRALERELLAKLGITWRDPA